MTPSQTPADLPPQGTATERYAQSRAALIAEQQKPEKDFARIDALSKQVAQLSKAKPAARSKAATKPAAKKAAKPAAKKTVRRAA